MPINLSGSLVLTGSLTVTGGITMSGSIASASYALSATSASYSSDSSLLAGRDSGVFATTGSNTFVGNQTITGSIFGSGSLTINGCITSTGQIVAQTINVQQVTSSIVYSCGSNIFGTAVSNTQQLTGSVGVTGSLTLIGPMIGSSTACFGGNITTVGCIGIGTNSAATPLHIVTAGLPAIRLTLGSEARCHNINGVNLGRDLQVLPFRHFSVQAGNGIAEGQIVLNAYEDFIVGTGASYTPRLTITPTGIATFACRVCAPNINLSNGISINACSTVTVADWYNTNTDDGNGLYIKAGGVNSGKYIMALESAAGCPRMIVLANGNIGIGTTSPTFALDVASTSADTLRLNRTGVGGTGSASSMSFQVTQTNAQSATLASISAEFITNWGGDLRLYTKPANGTPNDSVTERMRITSAGFVGIGCTSPSYSLDINDTNGSGVRGLRINTSSSSVGPSIVLRYSPGGLINWLVGTSQAVSHAFEFVASCALSGDPGVNGTTRMILTCGGQLGIGTTSTSAEANLFLGAQGVNEGGQLVLQKATNCNCATHLDNYQDRFRVMAGTNTASASELFSVSMMNGSFKFGQASTGNVATYLDGLYNATRTYTITGTTNGLIQIMVGVYLNGTGTSARAMWFGGGYLGGSSLPYTEILRVNGTYLTISTITSNASSSVFTIQNTFGNTADINIMIISSGFNSSPTLTMT